MLMLLYASYSTLKFKTTYLQDVYTENYKILLRKIENLDKWRFEETKKLILNFMWKYKGLRVAKTIWKKKKN